MLDVFAVRLDYLSATFYSERHGTLLSPILAQELGFDLVPGKPLHGMTALSAFGVPDGMGTLELFIQSDGTNRLHVRASGAVTDLAIKALFKIEPAFWQGHVTRYDVAVDGTATDEDFETLAKGVVTLATSALLRADGKPARSVVTSVAGDWFGGENGRTLYVGSPTSSIRARLYEKGVQLGGDPGWIRFEWQVRPSALTYVGEVTLNPPTDRYAAMVKRLTGLAGIPDYLRRVDPDARKGGLAWLEKMAVAMLSKVDEDARTQWLRRVQFAHY